MTRRIPKKMPRLDPAKVAGRKRLSADRITAKKADAIARVLGKREAGA